MLLGFQIGLGKHLPTLVGIGLKSKFFKNCELDWSNLPQNSNCGRELVQKSGVQIPVGNIKFFLSRFLFIFIFSIKNWILTHKILFFIFFYQLNSNKNRCIGQISFYFYLNVLNIYCGTAGLHHLLLIKWNVS